MVFLYFLITKKRHRPDVEKGVTSIQQFPETWKNGEGGVRVKSNNLEPHGST
jgi:hypothetical protein